MRAISAYLSLCSLLLACGTSSKNQTNVIFIVVPPPDGDVGCVGVAGFEVTISSGGRTSPSGPLLNDAGPVRESSACHLRHPFSLTDLDLESPASVTVTGYDGAGMARVQAIGHLDNLHANPPHLQLKSITTPPLPVLIINRNPLLGTTTKLSEVTHLLITTMRRPQPLLDITPGDYFSVEPGAYGVPSAYLSNTGVDSGIVLFADVTANGTSLKSRITATWNMLGQYYEAQ